MKVSLFVIATLLSTAAWSHSLPEGTWQGDGLWHSSLQKGSYKVETQIFGNLISNVYTLKDGTKKVWAFHGIPTNGNFFKVDLDDKEVGQGYCLDRATVCHYEASIGNMQLEETITHLDGKLYRFGSKVENGKRIMWQESMQPVGI